VVLIIQTIIYPNLAFKNKMIVLKIISHLSIFLATTYWNFFIWNFIFIFLKFWLLEKKPKWHSYFFTNLKIKLARFFFKALLTEVPFRLRQFLEEVGPTSDPWLISSPTKVQGEKNLYYIALSLGYHFSHCDKRTYIVTGCMIGWFSNLNLHQLLFLCFFLANLWCVHSHLMLNQC
jgi:hypothetical protein